MFNFHNTFSSNTNISLHVVTILHSCHSRVQIPGTDYTERVRHLMRNVREMGNFTSMLKPQLFKDSMSLQNMGEGLLENL